MPTEGEIRTWRQVARQPRMTRERLLESLLNEFDEPHAQAIFQIVAQQLPPPPRAGAARTPPRQARRGAAATQGVQQQTQATAAPGQNLPNPTSPYRFVELNKVVIPAPETVRQANLDLPLPGGFSGEISVEWVAETPLLIGRESGGGNRQEVLPLQLGTNGDYAIPGATLKGLLRSGIEIVTLGRLSQLNRQHRFGLRDFTDTRYGKDGAGHSRLAWDTIGAGWLQQSPANAEERKQGRSDYCITPCCKRIVRIRGLPRQWFTGNPTDGARHLEWLRLGLREKYRRAGMLDGNYDFLRTYPFSVLSNGDAVPAAGNGEAGVYVFSGPLPLPRRTDAELIAKLDAEDAAIDNTPKKKKREYVFFDRPNAEPLRIPQQVFDAFELINSTPSGRGLQPAGSWAALKPTLDAGGRIPVFILGNPTDPHFDFGLTRTFKVAHDYSVGQVLDARTNNVHRLRADMVPDWAAAMFGSVVEEDDLLEPGKPRPRRLPGEALPPSKLARKGRVAVGFALATTPAVLFPAMDQAAIQTTMMGPRASFAPHYLVGPRKHWSDPDAGLAGRKRYFPRFTESAPAEAQAMVMAERTLPASGSERTVSRLRFLVPANSQSELRFRGVIRVHNLLAEEVGALLWILTLGGGGGRLRHMIGRAKAFGAGQMRVENVCLARLYGHDSEADRLLGPRATVGPFLRAFEAAMDMAVRAAGLPGRWAEQAQVLEFLGLSDPTWGDAERQGGCDRYPGAVAAVRNGQPGRDMAQGPRAHMNLRRQLGSGDPPPRWLPTPRLPPSS